MQIAAVLRAVNGDKGASIGGARIPFDVNLKPRKRKRRKDASSLPGMGSMAAGRLADVGLGVGVTVITKDRKTGAVISTEVIEPRKFRGDKDPGTGESNGRGRHR